MIKTTKELWKAVGGLGKPSKMPGFSYDLSAEKCKTGSKLRHIKGSVCNSCYALKGRYMFPNVKEAHARRLKALLTDPMWEFNMVELLKRKYKNKIGKDRVVRIHSAGDFQNVTHLRKWCYIAEQTPDILYWAPSREALIIKSYLSKYDKFPDNFRLRVSNHMVNSHKSASNFPYMSSVITDIKYAKGDNICPATINGNDPTCDGNNCRKCWSTEKNINYLKH